MHRGWVRLYRRLQDNPIWRSEKFTPGQAWVDLFMIANYSPGSIRVRGNEMPVERGQVGWSKEALAERWRWSRGRVSRFLNALESKGMVIQQKSRVLSIITIVNYDNHQGDDTTDDTTDSTTDGQQTVQQTDTNKKNKKVNKEKKVKKLKNYPLDFETFWTLYPKRNGQRTGKEATCKRWDNLPEADRDSLLIATENYANSKQAIENYAKDPERFLKDDHWRDWIAPPEHNRLSPAGQQMVQVAKRFLEEDDNVE